MDGPPSPLIVAEKNSAFAEFFFENLALGPQAFDDFLLLTVAPAGEEGEEELPRLEDEVPSRPDAVWGTTIASGLEEDLSSA